MPRAGEWSGLTLKRRNRIRVDWLSLPRMVHFHKSLIAQDGFSSLGSTSNGCRIICGTSTFKPRIHTRWVKDKMPAVKPIIFLEENWTTTWSNLLTAVKRIAENLTSQNTGSYHSGEKINYCMGTLWRLSIPLFSPKYLNFSRCRWIIHGVCIGAPRVIDAVCLVRSYL